MALLSARPCYEGAEGCPICVLWNFCSPQSMHDGRQRKKKRKRRQRERQRSREPGRRGRRRDWEAEHQADRLCQPIRDALGSCSRGAAEPGSQERGASPGLSEDQRGEREHRQSPLYDARKLSSFPPLRAKSTKVRLP